MNPAPTAQEIRDLAKSLITDNKTTTSLDVKIALRNKGFWVTQAEVSTALADLDSSEFEAQQAPGGYRIYAAVGYVQAAPVPTAVTILSPPSATFLAGPSFHQQKWVCSERGWHDKKVIAADTRGKAKSLYSRMTGCPYLKVYTKKA